MWSYQLPLFHCKPRVVKKKKTCHHWWHRRLSICQQSVMTKLASGWLSVFSITSSSFNAKNMQHISRAQCNNLISQIHKYQRYPFCPITWWCHDMETLSTLLALCHGESTNPWWIMPQKPAMQNLNVSFIVSLNRQSNWTDSQIAGDLRQQWFSKSQWKYVILTKSWKLYFIVYFNATMIWLLRYVLIICFMHSHLQLNNCTC